MCEFAYIYRDEFGQCVINFDECKNTEPDVCQYVLNCVIICMTADRRGGEFKILMHFGL